VGCEQVAEFEEPAADAGLDCAQGFLQPGGDFLLRQAGEKRQLERALLLGGKPGDGGPDDRGSFGMGQAVG
jgi:hypothetical protein